MGAVVGCVVGAVAGRPRKSCPAAGMTPSPTLTPGGIGFAAAREGLEEEGEAAAAEEASASASASAAAASSVLARGPRAGAASSRVGGFGSLRVRRARVARCRRARDERAPRRLGEVLRLFKKKRGCYKGVTGGVARGALQNKRLG